MRYLLMMHTPFGTGDYQFKSWSPDDWKAHTGFLNAYNQDLTDAAEWVDVLGLTPPGQAKLVRAGKDGAPITDGPFPEAKEFLAGFRDHRRGFAEARVRACGQSLGGARTGGAPLNMPIEVRQAMSGPPKDA